MEAYLYKNGQNKEKLELDNEQTKILSKIEKLLNELLGCDDYLTKIEIRVYGESGYPDPNDPSEGKYVFEVQWENPEDEE